MRGTRRRWIVILSAALVAASGLVACGETASRVSVELFGWDGDFVEGMPSFDGAEEVRVRVTNPDTADVIEETSVGVDDGGARLPDVESGSGLRMDFEVRGGGETIAAGATPRFDIGDEGIASAYRVMISEVDDFAPVASLVRGESTGEEQLVQSQFDGRALDQMPLGRLGHSAHPTSSGEVLIVGGASVVGGYEPTEKPELAEAYADIQLFDPATGYFTELAGDQAAIDADVVGEDRLEDARAFHTVNALGDDRFLVVGGFTESSGETRPLNSIEYIDLNEAPGSRVDRLRGSSGSALTLTERRGHHTTTLRKSDGRVVVAGGMGASEDDLRASVDIVDPTQGEASVELGDEMTSPRVGHGSVLIEDDETIWIIGGRDDSSVLDSTDIIAADGESATTESGPVLGRSRHSASVVHLGDEGNDLVAVIGGLTNSGATAEFELGSPAGGFFRENSYRIDQARGGADLVRLEQSEDLLVVGGYDPDGEPLGSAERLSIDGSASVPLVVDASPGSMVDPRSEFGLSTVNNGRVIVVGGLDSSDSPRDDAEYFTPDDPVAP